MLAIARATQRMYVAHMLLLVSGHRCTTLTCCARETPTLALWKPKFDGGRVGVKGEEVQGCLDNSKAQPQ